jgi:hypothetical protein
MERENREVRSETEHKEEENQASHRRREAKNGTKIKRGLGKPTANRELRLEGNGGFVRQGQQSSNGVVRAGGRRIVLTSRT